MALCWKKITWNLWFQSVAKDAKKQPTEHNIKALCEETENEKKGKKFKEEEEKKAAHGDGYNIWNAIPVEFAI